MSNRAGRQFVSDRPIRYGMIVLDVAPAIERVRGQPMIFRSPEETVEYTKLHAIERWMVCGGGHKTMPGAVAPGIGGWG